MLEFYQLDYIDDWGNILQDITHSFSRSNLSSNTDQKLQYIKDSLKARGENYTDCTVLTFKNFKSLFKDAGFNVEDNVHFGNTCGYDDLKGKILLSAEHLIFQNLL